MQGHYCTGSQGNLMKGGESEKKKELAVTGVRMSMSLPALKHREGGPPLEWKHLR